VIRFQRILCPIDFSETSDRGLSHAIALATWYEAQLTVLHVVPVFHECASSSVEPHERGRKPCPSRDEIIAEMRDSVARGGPTVLIPALETDEGRVHETIVNRAASLPADLLVLGTHGRGGFNRLFLGSVTEKVLRTTSCPVLTVPPSVPATPPVPVTFKKILCAIDFSPSSLKALQYAVDLGRQADGSITVLHALEFEVPEDCDELIEHVRGQLHAQVGELPQTWCDIDEVVTMKRAYRAILQRADASGTDLIVMGAQGSGGVELMFYGSTTQHVVRQARCPVLTVRA
jgi:nucleotide-binding universal stress UspA family protein